MMGIELVFCDMEGTLYRKAVKSTHGIAPSLWTRIAMRLGDEAYAEEEARKKEWAEGKLTSYTEWQRLSLQSYQNHGLTREIFEEVAGTIELHPGVPETFEEFRRRNYRTALISGGFKIHADRAQVELGIDYAFSAADLFWKPNGTLGHFNVLPTDMDAKRKLMNILIEDHHLSPDQCAFIGDGSNDVYLAEAVGRSISFNGHPKLEAVATHVIRQPEGQEDFRAVLPYL